MMSKIVDFYKKAMADPKMKQDLEAINKKYEGQGEDKKGEGRNAIIEMAKKYGVTLVPADFEIKNGGLSEDELAAVAGGQTGNFWAVQVFDKNGNIIRNKK
jgi:hypothetical protein